MAFHPRWTPPTKLRDREIPDMGIPISPLKSTYSGSVSGRPVLKESRVKHEGYRRLVAALPCVYCGIHGYSQAAHPPPTGKGIKEDDRECFPLCCTRPGITGCHFEFDQYRLIPKDDMRRQAAEWGNETRETIERNGDWPESCVRWT